jgi:hypothetical protein
MTKYCHNCNGENPDDAFWCTNCNTKIINTRSENHRSVPISSSSEPGGHHHGMFVGISLVSIIIGVVCLLVYTVFNGSIFAFSHQNPFSGVHCEMNEDFWFDGQYLNTSTGWSFVLTMVKQYSLEGKILALKTYSNSDYPYDPCNCFSPVDFFIGIDDVQTDTSTFEYSITSYSNRVVTWYLYNDDLGSYLYFKSHTGNNHIIPHTKEVLDTLLHNVSSGMCVVLNGSVVNLYGTNGNQFWRWNTDTEIGNYECEIILVDEIRIIPCD